MSSSEVVEFKPLKVVKTLTTDQLQEWLSDSVTEWPDRLIVLLQGPMGIGKTQFVREALIALGYHDVSSPSFSILNQYSIGNILIDHVDLYRLTSDEDLESTGFWDLFEKTSGIIFIEWADRLPLSCFPLDWKLMLVDIKFEDDGSRLFHTSMRI